MCAVDRPIYRKRIIPASVVHRIYKTKQDLHDHLEKSCKSCLRFELVNQKLSTPRKPPFAVFMIQPITRAVS